MRRTSFTAYLEDREDGLCYERICMAWNLDQVKAYYEESRPRARVIRVSPTPKRKTSAPMWEANQARLLRAYKTLDIRWPVQIRRTCSKQHQGAHKLKIHGNQATPTHMIVVDKSLTPYQASRVLWHELAHAAQSERVARSVVALNARAMGAAWRGANLRSRKIPYSKRPCEVEARYVENLHLDDILTSAAS